MDHRAHLLCENLQQEVIFFKSKILGISEGVLLRSTMKITDVMIKSLEKVHLGKKNQLVYIPP